MKKIFLKHLTVTGFIQGKDLTEVEVLEDNLSNAKINLKNSKRNVKDARKRLDMVIVESIKKIEVEKNTLVKEMNTGKNNIPQSTLSKIDEIKSKYDKTMTELELKRNRIMNKIDDYKSDGTEQWASFKDKLNHDLEELGKTFKRFTTYLK